MLLLWLIFLCVFVLYVYKILIKPYQKWKNLNVPHLRPWPLLGNFGPFILRKQSFAHLSQNLYNAFDTRYVGFYAFSSPRLLIKDLDLIKRIGIKDFDQFVDHFIMISEDSDPLFGKNLFSLRGDKWRNMRSVLSPAFTGSKMRAMYYLISECAEHFTNHFLETLKPNQKLTIELKDTFTKITNDVIATTAFGVECNSLKDENNEFYVMGQEIRQTSGMRMLKVFAFGICKNLMKFLNVQIFSPELSKFFRSIITSSIKMREENGIIRPDMIHLLMEAKNGRLRYEEGDIEEPQLQRNQKYNYTLTDDDITAQAILFFIAGFDTVSLTMCHMIYELAQHEEMQKRLQEEIDSAWNESNGKLTYDSIMKLKYLDMVLNETLRKWPPLPVIDRVCNQTYQIPATNPNEQMITIEKGEQILFPFFALHRDPKYFPNPEQFDPERFSDENKSNIKPMSYLPFGVGPRSCIGSRFALLEIKTIMCFILYKLSFEICAKSQIPLKLEKRTFNTNAENGFWLNIKLRN